MYGVTGRLGACSRTLDVVEQRLESQGRVSLGVSTGSSMLWRARHVGRRAVGDNGKYGGGEIKGTKFSGWGICRYREGSPRSLFASGEKGCNSMAGVDREGYLSSHLFCLSFMLNIFMCLRYCSLPPRLLLLWFFNFFGFPDDS